tara:strand:- start:4011 stop:5003 length:993 start_codon:yes stop_codon:yes gene_type:complete
MAFTFNSLGNADGANGSANDLFLKQFSGEVITAFETANVMMPLHTVRTISQGHTAQFPIIGTGAAEYHTAGTDMLIDGGLSSIVHNERRIGIDALLTSYQFIDSLDDAKNHYDYRSEYSRKMGYALAKSADKSLINVLYNGSQVTASDDVPPEAVGGGNIELSGDNGAESSTNMIDALFSAAAVLDAAGVPDQERYVLLSPTYYYKLIASTSFDVSTSVANSDIGGSGFGSGIVPMVAGFEIFKTNHLPTASETDDAKIHTDNNYVHTAPTNGLKGLVFHKSAIGTVKLRDLSMESEYQIARQGTLMVAKYAMGHGILRPSCAVALINAS